MAVLGALLTAAFAPGVLSCRGRPQATAPKRTDASPSLPAAARPSSAGYSFTAAEKAAISEFLRANPGLRIATDADCHIVDDDAEVRSLYGIYHPYFVRGDLNDDGALDFVLGFVRRSSGSDGPGFSVVVFAGREGAAGPSTFSPGAILERDISLSHGDLSIDRDAVLITPDLAEDWVRRYRWDPVRRSYIFVREPEDEPERPVLSRT